MRQAVIFHSPADHVRRYRPEMPFTLIADPDRTIYTRFGVHTSPRALLHPQAIIRLTTEARTGNTAQQAHGGIHGLPADFLIATNGNLILAHYGTHANDNLPIQDILAAISPRHQQARAEGSVRPTG